MKETKKFNFILISLALILIFYLAGCNGNVQDSSTREQVSIDTSEPEPNQVICKNNRFIPDTLTVKEGTTVTWVNQDTYIHTVTSGRSPGEQSGLFDSGNLNKGQTFSFTFDKAGTYDYFCIPHFSMGMIGKIVVTE